MSLKFFFTIFSQEYGISLLILNLSIYIWLLMCIFGLLFLFDLKFFKVLSDLKGFWSFFFISIALILNLLSMAGIPPMLGFVGKFLLFLFFLLKQNFYIAILFTLINFFIMYFYIQNIRFLLTKSSSYFFFLKLFFALIDYNLIIFIIFLNFFNYLGIFFFNDFLLFCSSFSAFMFLE